jgi:hypothetical protein
MKRIITLLAILLVILMALAPVTTLAKGWDAHPRGDANSDNVVNIQDVIVCERMILGLQHKTIWADANHDWYVNMADVICIERIILGLPIPAGKY